MQDRIIYKIGNSKDRIHSLRILNYRRARNAYYEYTIWINPWMVQSRLIKMDLSNWNGKYIYAFDGVQNLH